ncbi:uncharacterized protein LOC144377167 [Ictidomys tridecemlineatus]
MDLWFWKAKRRLMGIAGAGLRLERRNTAPISDPHKEDSWHPGSEGKLSSGSLGYPSPNVHSDLKTTDHFWRRLEELNGEQKLDLLEKIAKKKCLRILEERTVTSSFNNLCCKERFQDTVTSSWDLHLASYLWPETTNFPG